MTRKHLIKVANLEIAAWNRGQNKLPGGLVLAILFAFIHHATTGETVEETFFQPQTPALEYEI
jgi:hypothetical protein